MKILEFFLLLLVLGLNLANNRPHAINIIGKRNTGECFNKNEYSSFSPISGPEIPKAHGQHNIGAPIIPPYILNIPRLILNIHNIIPIIIGVTNTSHEV